ncbi:unnamed protein product [Staurois parvus]|uniref:Uncharacterized protein n=1 Tax=Staurois parvus TaxID=386267 RepID=A0ABN9FI66_9NEOB|nr:unnamed protein product [Staurois parvus]
MTPNKTYRVESLCTCSNLFLSWESPCDQHRANHHCPDRGHRFCILIEQNENSSYKL